MGAMGCFVSYLATTMTPPRSPILIPQLSYKIKELHVLRQTRQRKRERECLTPHKCRLTSQNRLCNNTYGLLLVTNWLSNWFLKWVTLFITKLSFHSNPSCLLAGFSSRDLHKFCVNPTSIHLKYALVIEGPRTQLIPSKRLTSAYAGVVALKQLFRFGDGILAAIALPNQLHEVVADRQSHILCGVGFRALSVLADRAGAAAVVGHVFAFRGRRGDIVKVLWLVGDRLCLLAKLLNGDSW
jgi:hypothetical protein